MFVSYSEIKVSVIVKHMQHISIIRAFFLPGWRDLLSFSVPGGAEKIAGLWFAWGDQHLVLQSHRSTMGVICLLPETMKTICPPGGHSALWFISTSNVCHRAADCGGNQEGTLFICM